jgi:hypothetical protein
MPLQLGQVVFFLWLQSLLQDPAARTRDPGALDSIPLFVSSCYLIFFAAMVLCRNLAARRPYLARESLYPVRRADLVGSICLSVAWDTAILAVGHCAGLGAGLALFGGERALAALIVPYLALTLVQYVVLYCAVLWLGTLGRVSASILGLAAVCALSSASAAAILCFGGSFRSPENVMTLTIVAVATVLLPFFAALRRWCRVELG